MEDSLMNITKAASYLGIKVSRLRYAVRKKQVPYLKIGRLIRFEKVWLNEWLNTLRRYPAKWPYHLLKEFSTVKITK